MNDHPQLAIHDEGSKQTYITRYYPGRALPWSLQRPGAAVLPDGFSTDVFVHMTDMVERLMALCTTERTPEQNLRLRDNLCGRMHLLQQASEEYAKRPPLESRIEPAQPTPAKGKQDFDGVIDGVGYKQSMDDPDKPPMGLVPPELGWAVAQVLGYGAKKYARGQWMRGMSFTACSDAIERHLAAWKRGEDLDPESGLPHLAHLGCSLAFLLHFQEGPRHAEYERFDDRLFATQDPREAPAVDHGEGAEDL